MTSLKCCDGVSNSIDTYQSAVDDLLRPVSLFRYYKLYFCPQTDYRALLFQGDFIDDADEIDGGDDSEGEEEADQNSDDENEGEEEKETKLKKFTGFTVKNKHG